MARKTPKVHLLASPLFYDKIFEPQRKKLAVKIGKSNLTQWEFTHFLAKSNAKIIIPKSSYAFAPKKKKRGGSLFYL